MQKVTPISAKRQAEEARLADEARQADYQRRGASKLGVYVENVIEGCVKFSGGFVKFRLVCDPVDDRWRGSREVDGPLPPNYDGWHVRVYDRAHDGPEAALRAMIESARGAISVQRDKARNDHQRSKVDAALRKLEEWAKRNVQKSLAAEGGAAVVERMV
ncbi:MAG TPA: hypothetical protein VIP46_02760 [Pyrinomonadaceae bacterium]